MMKIPGAVKRSVGLLLLAVVAMGLFVPPASAWDRRFHRHVFVRVYPGVVVVPPVAPSYVAVYPASPVYSYVPACSTSYTNGYWRQVPMYDDHGFVTYRTEWVPGYWRSICP